MAGLLGVFILMVGDTMVSAYSANGRTRERVARFRQAANLLDEIGRQVQCCSDWYSPPSSWDIDSPYSPDALTNQPAVRYLFYSDMAGGQTEVLWWWNSKTQEVFRQIAEPGKAAQRRLVATGITGFTFVKLKKADADYKFLKVQLSVQDRDRPLVEEVGVKLFK